MDDLLTHVLNVEALSDVTSATRRPELELLVAKAQRRAMQLQLSLRDGSTLELEVLPQWTVAQLKRSIERAIALRVQTLTGRTRCISWKSHWKRWAIEHDGAQLDDGRRSLESYGVSTHAVLHFVPRVPTRRAASRAPEKKRRRAHTADKIHKEPSVL